MQICISPSSSSPLSAQFPYIVVVVSGETGCGKTTQLPQYILESEVEAARGAAYSCTQDFLLSLLYRRCR